MRYSSIQLSTNNTSGGFYSVDLDVGILEQEEREAFFRDGYVISFHKKYSNFTSYNIFFTEAHPYFNAGFIGTASYDLSLSYDLSDDLYNKYINNYLFYELLDLFDSKQLQKV
jgi:hypothetical protein